MGMEGNVLANVIWDKHASPTNYVSRTLGIEHWKLRAAIHKIKAKANLGPVDDVIIYDDGTVTDSADNEIGNIYDEL
jgi:hypothetical protein